MRHDRLGHRDHAAGLAPLVAGGDAAIAHASASRPRLSRLDPLRAQSARHARPCDLHRPHRVRAGGAIVAPQNPNAGDLGQRLLPPGGDHWLGTDQQGRDIWTRIVYGSRTTLLIIFLVAVTAAPIGVAIGATAGYLGGWVEGVLMRITDAFLAFPRLVLALAFAAALGPGIENAVLAIALTAWPPYARIARAETLTVRNTDYVAAARISGASGSAS